MSAGLTPLMREAWPNGEGFMGGEFLGGFKAEARMEEVGEVGGRIYFQVFSGGRLRQVRGGYSRRT